MQNDTSPATDNAVAAAALDVPAEDGFGPVLDALAAVSPEDAAGDAIAGATQPLPYREELEASFGKDLGHLHAHLGATALGDVGSGAAQVGDDLAFASLAPDKGQVAHEVAHTLQGERRDGATTRGEPAEAEADAIASDVTQGRAVGDVTGDKSGAAAMDWLIAADPSREEFWNQLRSAVATQMGHWLSHKYQNAVDTWATHMQASAEESTSGVAIDAVLTALGAVEGASLAATILTIGKSVLTQVQSMHPEPQVGFHEFVQANKEAVAWMSDVLAGPANPTSMRVDQMESEERDTADTAVRARALAEARAAVEALPDFKTIERALISGWMDGAQDGWDLEDDAFVPDDAGYFYVSSLLANKGDGAYLYHGLRAELDDVDRPEGTIVAIHQAWGKDTPLTELPFAMEIDLDVVTNEGLDTTQDELYGFKTASQRQVTWVDGDPDAHRWVEAHPVTTAVLEPD